MLLQLKPVRPRPLILAQHKLDQISEFRGVILLEEVDVVLKGLPVNARVLVAIALILVAEQAGLENDHAHGPDIALEGLILRGGFFLLEGLNLLRRKVSVLAAALVEQGLVVATGASGDRIVDLDDSLGGDEDCAGSQGCVLDVIFLQVAEAQDAAGQYRPQFLLLEPPLLQRPLVDLVVQRALRELKERIQLVKAHAKLILSVGDDANQRGHMLVTLQLLLLDFEGLLKLEKGVLIMAANLSKQVFLLGLAVLEVPDAFAWVFLEELELFKHFLVGLVEGGSPVSHSLVNS